MKKTKQFLALFMSVVMILSIFASTGVISSAEEVDIIDYLTYKITDGEVTINVCDTSISGDVAIPETIEGYPVTSIGGHAFLGCSSLTSITIPDGVTSIGYSAFRECRSLTNITIPDSVTFIDERAFYYCNSITDIKIPYGVTSIGDYTFRSCFNLTSITIPDSVTSIGAGAFETCTSLTNITIPDSVTSIGYAAFWGCDSLVEIAIPDSVITIGDNAFVGCDNLTTITIGKGASTINNTTFDLCANFANITVDEDNANYSSDEYGVLFNKDKTVLIKYPNGNVRTGYTIPDGVTEIGTEAFEQCSNLTNITIPDSVTYIGKSVFDDCEKITKFTVDENNINYLTDEYGVLFNKDKTELIQYPAGSSRTEYAIPDSVTTISDSAFEGSKNLVNITIPNSVTSIGSSAFQFCFMLKSITVFNPDCSIYDSTGTISSSATIYGYPGSTAEVYAEKYERSFVALEEEKEYEVFGSLKYELVDGEITIVDCDETADGDIEIPATIEEYPVTKIGENAFDGCTNITSITFTNPDCVIFDSEGTIPAGATIYGYPDSTAEAYAEKYERSFVSLDVEDEEDENTGIFGNLSYEIVDNTVIITDCDESDSDNIVIPAEIEGLPVVAIGAEAFSGWTSLTEIIIPDTVKTIENNAFSGCTSLKKVVALGVESIGAEAFSGCTSLDTFIAFADTIVISDTAFDVIEKLTMFAKDTAKITAPTTLDIITFSFAGGTLSFSGEYKSDLYYLLDLIAVMCTYYDDVQYLFFDSFEAVSADEGHIYYYTENGQRKEFDGTKASNVKFSVEAFDTAGKMRKFSFNELCSAVANDEISNFFLIIEEADGLDKGDIEMTLVDRIHQGLTRILKAIVNLLNKLFSFFKSLGA